MSIRSRRRRKKPEETSDETVRIVDMEVEEAKLEFHAIRDPMKDEIRFANSKRKAVGSGMRMQEYHDGKNWKNPKQERFLKAVSLLGSVHRAAKMMKISKRLHYYWMKNARYARRFQKAMSMAGDVLEGEAFRRAVKGWDEPVFYKGEIAGYVRKKSDRMLELLLKAYKPEKYGDVRRLEAANNQPTTNILVYLPDNGRGGTSPGLPAPAPAEIIDSEVIHFPPRNPEHAASAATAPETTDAAGD